MPKIVSAAEYEVVVNAVRGRPDGASIEMIQSVLGEGAARRTLQRRLNELVKQGRLIAEGRKRGALYRLPAEPQVTVRLEGVSAKGEVGQVSADIYVPMSADGSRLRDLVRRPLPLRTPVGFRRQSSLRADQSAASSIHCSTPNSWSWPDEPCPLPKRSADPCGSSAGRGRRIGAQAPPRPVCGDLAGRQSRAARA